MQNVEYTYWIPSVKLNNGPDAHFTFVINHLAVADSQKAILSNLSFQIIKTVIQFKNQDEPYLTVTEASLFMRIYQPLCSFFFFFLEFLWGERWRS